MFQGLIPETCKDQAEYLVLQDIKKKKKGTPQCHFFIIVCVQYITKQAWNHIYRKTWEEFSE